MAAKTSPLGIPYSDSTVSVSILNSTAYLAVPFGHFVQPAIEGIDNIEACCFSFLIEHKGRRTTAAAAHPRRVVFDLAVRKDWATGCSPALRRHIGRLTAAPGTYIRVEKDVADVLAEHGVPPDSVEAVVWSHTHVDHIGNPARFGPGTDLVVGPGFGTGRGGTCGCEGGHPDNDEAAPPDLHIFPGYPADPDSVLLESDYQGRTLRELTDRDFAASGVAIAGCRACDYFGDGSLYLLDAPGHSPGHLCGLARVHADPALPNGGHFVLMGGDAFHHMAEFRPSPYVPLPTTLPAGFGGGPTAKLLPLLQNAAEHQGRTPASDETLRQTAFVVPAGVRGASVHLDPAEALATIRKLQALDGDENILVVAAHDQHLMDRVEADQGLFPATANDFVARGWNARSRWTFLKDLAVAVGEEKA